MHSSLQLALFLGGFITVIPAFHLPISRFANLEAPERRQDASTSTTVLKPLKPTDFQTAAGFSPAAQAVSSASVNPTAQTELAFGATLSDGTMLLSNMTLVAPNTKQIVTVENFEQMTSNVACTDTGVSLTFTDSSMFTHAVASWNSALDEGDLIFIVNQEGCGAADERAAFTYTFPSPRCEWRKLM
jgi:hypothetical protein